MNLNNFYINFHQERIIAATTQKRLDTEKQRAITRAAGLCLGRGFNESDEDFKKRHPDVAEFMDWNSNVAQHLKITTQ